MDKVTTIGVIETLAALRRAGDSLPALEDKLQYAMKHMKDHWMVTNNFEQFQAAISAVLAYLKEDSEDFIRLKHEIDGIRQLNAYISAAQAGLDLQFDMGEKKDIKPVKIAEMWRDINEPENKFSS